MDLKQKFPVKKSKTVQVQLHGLWKIVKLTLHLSIVIQSELKSKLLIFVQCFRYKESSRKKEMSSVPAFL